MTEDMIDSNYSSPVILFVYSRLENTKRTLKSIQECVGSQDTEVFVFCDAPNPNSTPEQLEEIYATHKYLRDVKTSFKGYHLEISEIHRGAGSAIIRGISNVLKQFPTCIVVENDMVLKPLFLQYMNSCLKTYQDDMQVYGISGTGYKHWLPSWYKKDVYLLPRPESWGWATWSNRWEGVDWKVSDFEVLRNSKRLQREFNRGGNDMYDILLAQMEGRVDTWDLQWSWHVFKKKGYFLYSRWSFVQNEGFDGSGRHCGENDTITSFFAPFYPEENLRVKLPELKPSCLIIESFRLFYNKNLSYIEHDSFLKLCKQKTKHLLKKLLGKY